MRRPLSIMRADARGGWIEMLYKALGPGLHALAGRKVGDELSVLGPIGRPFVPHRERPRTLLLGGGVGIPPWCSWPSACVMRAVRPTSRSCSWVRKCRFRFAPGPRR